MTESPFSLAHPKLQIAWDSTSLRALMFCPRYYELTILEGWRGSTVDLEFGQLVHGSLEAFDRARLNGLGVAAATQAALRWAVENSGTYEGDAWRTWGGVWAPLWRCTHKPGKGKKKCPYAHAGKWWPVPAPVVCGQCGSPIQEEVRWVPDDPVKNRNTLIRLVEWYCSEQPETGGVQPYRFPDGTQGVELSFRLPLPFTTGTGQRYLLCGHLDGIAVFDEHYVRERKTTKHGLTKTYFDGYSPDIQMDIYDLAGNVMFPDLGIKGVLVEAMQTQVGGCRIARQVLYRSNAQREEFLADLGVWLVQAERFAEAGYWPMNRASCRMCGLKGICSMEPAARERALEAEFQRKPWNPLETR